MEIPREFFGGHFHVVTLADPFPPHFIAILVVVRTKRYCFLQSFPIPPLPPGAAPAPSSSPTISRSAARSMGRSPSLAPLPPSGSAPASSSARATSADSPTTARVSGERCGAEATAAFGSEAPPSGLSRKETS